MSSGTDLVTRRQLRGLNRLGDVFLPGGEGMPSFSESRCADSVDHVVRYLPDQDRKDMGMLLGILGLLPAFLSGLFVALLDRSDRIPGSVGSLLRFARVGIRGLVMSLYFSDRSVLRSIDYDVNVYLKDLETVDAVR